MFNDHALSCQELVDLSTAYLEGVLPGEERRRFEQHLVDCSPCQIYLRQTRQTIRLVGFLLADTLAPPQKELLLKNFRDWKQH